MGGVAEISATIAAPGRIGKVSPFNRIRFGELDNRDSERARLLAQSLDVPGIDHAQAADIHVAIWNKFILLAGMSALTALTRKPIGEIRSDPDTRELLEQVVSEVFAVGRARGVALSNDAVAERLRVIDGMPAEMRASMAIDLSQGRRLELPWLSGGVVRLGNELGVPVPANDFVCRALKLHQMGEI